MIDFIERVAEVLSGGQHETSPEVMRISTDISSGRLSVDKFKEAERARTAVLARPWSLGRLREDSSEHNGEAVDDWTLAGSVVETARALGWTHAGIVERPGIATAEAVSSIVSRPADDGSRE